MATSAAALMDERSATLAANWWALLLRGLFAILFGAFTLLLPRIALGSFVLLFAAYMLADGVMAIVAGVRAARARERWGLLIVEGLLDILLGIAVVLVPHIAVITLIWLIGAWAVVSGAALLAAAFRLHMAHGRWMMALAGLLSIVWGVLLFISPITGAVVLTLWIGVYAIAFGLALIVLAFQLRGRLHAGQAASPAGA